MTKRRTARRAPELLDVVLDVVVRFREHRAYGTREKAVRALRRRHPGLAVDEYDALFERHLAILDATVAAVRSYVARVKPISGTGFAEFTDIDPESVLGEVRAAFPDESQESIELFYEWVVYWHYLR